MTELPDLIREYTAILDQESLLDKRKQEIRGQILGHLAGQNQGSWKTPFGTAKRCSRFKLTPRREAVLGLLSRDDLFPFAQFTSARVKELLVPTYGRERLLPLFEIEKTDYLMIQRPQAPKRPFG